MVNWTWKNKIGDMTFKRKVEDKTYKQIDAIYKGDNCMGVKLAVNKGEYYFNGFWNDIHHLKRCLGLEGGESNIYENCVKVRLNVYFKDAINIAKEFAKAGIPVYIYYKEVK